MNRPSRPAMVHMALGAFAVLLVLRSAHLQLWSGRELASRAASQYFRVDTIPAPRGEIVDASGKPLSVSIEHLTIAVAPGELRSGTSEAGRKDRSLLTKTLAKLGVPTVLRQRALTRGKDVRWVQLPGRFMPADLQDVRNLRGVYVRPVIQRASFASPGVLPFLGRVGPDGSATGGLERILDSELQGSPGLIRVVTSPAGTREREVVVKELAVPVPGNSVTLSINKDLQGIAEWALSDAVKTHEAMDGDIVIVSPQSGEILAMASYGKDAGFATTAMVAAPFEPGSSLKPLLAARILELQRASPDEVVETTELEIPGWDKPLSDDHPAPTRSFHEVIKHSSNVGMVQFAWRLSAREHYEALRDFGLGMPTGVSLPGEASGRLDPIGWTQATQASAAMGYGVSVTSLQLAMAYASIANGGELLTPSLVKEIRDPRGNILFRHTRRVVRRVMSPQVAAQMRLMLRDVVQGGTALAADIELGELAGKTGTSRYAGANGYERGKHIATFAGMFPARDPQYVIVVRLVDPDGTYGGTTAAPVTAAVLRAAAVAQDALLDQRTISATASRGAEESGTAVAAAGFAALSPDESEPNGSDDADEGQLQARARVIDLAGGAQGLRESSMLRPVPRVAGLPLRDAVFLLHRAGFKVKVSRGSPGSSAGNGGSRNGGGGTGAVSAVAQNGEAVATAPAAGSARKRGDLILLYSGQ